MTERRPLVVTIEVGAERESRDAFLWYFDRNPEAGLHFEAELDQVIAMIAEAPLAQPEIEPGVRRILFPRFPYAAFYSVEASHITLLAVAHTRRRPGYWQGR